jgi:hypothetical protein
MDSLDFNSLLENIETAKSNLSQAKNTIVEDKNKNFSSNNVEKILEELYILVSNGKNLLATAINNKSGGEDAIGTMTFEELVQCINNIEIGTIEFKRTIKETQIINTQILDKYIDMIFSNIENINLILLPYLSNSINEIQIFDKTIINIYTNINNQETIQIQLKES